MNLFLSLLNAADKPAVIETNFERLDALLTGCLNLLFSSEAPVIEDYYVGGRYRFATPVRLQSATVVCSAPSGAAITFTLEVDGTLTEYELTVPDGQTSAELDLADCPQIAAGDYIRWQCTASPEVEHTASQIHITTNANPSI